jgi:hypothetical protein
MMGLTASRLLNPMLDAISVNSAQRPSVGFESILTCIFEEFERKCGLIFQRLQSESPPKTVSNNDRVPPNIADARLRLALLQATVVKNFAPGVDVALDEVSLQLSPLPERVTHIARCSTSMLSSSWLQIESVLLA